MTTQSFTNMGIQRKEKKAMKLFQAKGDLMHGSLNTWSLTGS